MKLYYSPQVCSLVPHIVLRELGAPFELVRVDFKSKTTSTGVALDTITPKSYVPVLELDGGERLTELSVIIRYLADMSPAAGLAPAQGTFERVRFDELVHFIATELHKGFAPYTMMPNVGDEAMQWTKDRLVARVALIRAALGSREFIFGDRFTVADPYAFWALRVFGFLTKVPLDGSLKEYVSRLAARPAVREAVDAEKR
ncbi:MAG: glutathione S-transferase N-terminal domain-containing protein [Labilithrix sp.]|nr:glutathione S-transferase N-terminal domain-containing protein [Labilithrix sp.]